MKILWIHMLWIVKKFVCSRTNHLEMNDKSFWDGKQIGECKNKCCKFYCKLNTFYIQWV